MGRDQIFQLQCEVHEFSLPIAFRLLIFCASYSAERTFTHSPMQVSMRRDRCNCTLAYPPKDSHPHLPLYPFVHHTITKPIFYWFAGPRAPLGVPCRKPFLNLRGTSLRDRMRPVPVVFLRFAFSPQLSA